MKEVISIICDFCKVNLVGKGKGGMILNIKKQYLAILNLTIK